MVWFQGWMSPRIGWRYSILTLKFNGPTVGCLFSGKIDRYTQYRAIYDVLTGRHMFYGTDTPGSF